jgi:hypothetical protein
METVDSLTDFAFPLLRFEPTHRQGFLVNEPGTVAEAALQKPHCRSCIAETTLQKLHCRQCFLETADRCRI